LRVRRALFLTGVAVAVAAVVSAGTQASASNTADVQQAGVAVHELTDDQVRSVLAPVTDITPGSAVTQYTVADALDQLQMPKNLVITPAVCTYLVDLSGIDGWTQTAVTPDGHFQQSLAGVLPGGFDLDQIRANAESCVTGTIAVPELGLKGTVSLTEFAVPTVDGIEAIGINQVVSFAGDTSDAARQLEKMTSSQVYLTSGDFVASSCLPHLTAQSCSPGVIKCNVV